jgi:hypothetical protein
MLLAVDFDGTIVDDRHAYDDLKTPLRFLPGAREALRSLKAADHALILYSGRANPWLLRNPEMDPLVLAGLRKARDNPQSLAVNRARYTQMLAFVKRELPGVFSLVWEHQGKPAADVFIDDRSAPFREGGWSAVAETYGAGLA